MSFRVPRRRRALAFVACAALFASGQLVDGSTVDASVLPSTSTAVRRSNALLELRAMAGSSARFSAAGIGGAATFVGGSPARPLTGPDDGDPSDVARDFVDDHAQAFGVDDPGGDLVEDRSEPSVDGGTAVRFRQEHDGVPVLGAEIAVQMAADGRVLSTSGEAAPDLDVATDPAVEVAAAAAAALAMTARNAGVDAATLVTGGPELMIYEPDLIGAPATLGARLVWRVDVRTPIGDIDEFVLVDASTGAIAFHFDQREDVRSAAVCDNASVPRADFSFAACNSAVRTQGSGPSGITDVEDAYQLSLATYDFYMDRFGRDSVNNAGLLLRSTVRFCLTGTGNCPYVNAFWNGAQMVYGEGYASADDVVAHELTHGVTQYTSQLLYFGESGAINESMSDVMGELMDLQHGSGPSDPPSARWLLGESLTGGAVRSMADPPASRAAAPDRAGSPLYVSGINDSGGVHINSGISNKAAFLMTDGGTFNGQTITGIGEVKTGRIYYQAETTLLGPGSDFLDLYFALQQACTNLTATGSPAISAADCESVRRAVTATEMNLAAATGGTRVTAPVCDTDTSVTSTILSDDFEAAGLPQWSTSSSRGGAPFVRFEGSSQSGTHSLHVDDVEGLAGPGSGPAAEAHTIVAATIPAGVTTYLRFDHSFNFDYEGPTDTGLAKFWDGGLVGYSTTGATGNYTDVAMLGAGAAVNGYPHSLVSGSANLYQGSAAFSGVTQTYQSTRYDVSSLAGKQVWFGFFFGGDKTVASDGWFIDDLSVYTCGSVAPAPTTGGFVPIGPERIFDTRGESPNARIAVPVGKVLPAADLAVQVTGLGAGTITPASGVGAVSLNVAVTNPAAAGFVTVYPCANRKLVASVNFGTGQTVSNAVIAPVSGAGTICFYSFVPTDLVVDINGWFPTGAAFTAVGPERVFDTRGESTNALVAVPVAKVVPGGDLTVQVAGLASSGGPVTPASGLGAVSLNVAVTNPAAAGFVTVYPCANRKLVASVNFSAGSTLSNAVVAPVSGAGTICFYSLVPTDLIVDINGWFPIGASFMAVGPERVFDTRGESTNSLVTVPVGRVRPDADLAVQVTGLTSSAGTITPATGVGAVSLNVAVTNPAAAGFVTVYPCANRKLVASVNFGAGQTVSNAVIAPVSGAGTICFYSLVPTDLIVDINGWFPAA